MTWNGGNGENVGMSKVLLEVAGAVEQPARFDYAALEALPGQVPDVSRLVPGRAGGGVALATVLAGARVKVEARYITLETSDGKFSASVPLDAVAERGIVVYRDGDAPLAESKGGPVRFYIRDVESCGIADLDKCANVKYLRRITLSAQPGRDTRPATQKQHTALHEGETPR